MTNETLRNFIDKQGYTGALYATDPSFDNSIIGVTASSNIVYDYERMCCEMAIEMDGEYAEGLNFDELLSEAYQYVDYNVIRSLPYMGACKPIVIYKNRDVNRR